MATFEDIWDEVKEELYEAKGISFDGCHKIYILKDDQQVKQSAEWGYGEDGSFLVTDSTPSEMLTLVKRWYEGSCALKFVEAVSTNEDDPNEGYESVIPQGYEDEFCAYCGESGADYDSICDRCREDEDEDEDED